MIEKKCCMILQSHDRVRTDVMGIEGMLYFLPQFAPRDYPRLNLKRGAPMCKVLADSFDELAAWGRRHGLGRIHISRRGKPHYDLWGPHLVLCPDHREMRRQRSIYHANFLKIR